MGPRVPCDAGTCFRNQGTNWEAQGYQWEIKVELIQGTEGSKAPGAVSKALGTDNIGASGPKSSWARGGDETGCQAWRWRWIKGGRKARPGQ